MDKVKSMEECVKNCAVGFNEKEKNKYIPFIIVHPNCVKEELKRNGYIHKDSVPRLDEEKILSKVIHNSRLYNIAKIQAEKEGMNMWYVFERGICLELAKALSTHFQSHKCEHEELDEEKCMEEVYGFIKETLELGLSKQEIVETITAYLKEQGYFLKISKMDYVNKKEVKDILYKYRNKYVFNRLNFNGLLQEICQKFSKPSVKVPNRKKVVWGKERIMIKDIQYERNIGYNQAIQEVKRINNLTNE